MDTMLSQEGQRSRASTCRRTPTACSSVADHCLRSRELRQPHHHRQAAAAAVARHRRGAASTARAAPRSGSGPSTERRRRARRRARVRGRHRRRWRRWPPRGWLREHAPELRVRVVNVVDLMTLFSPDEHPHGMTDETLRRALHRATPTSSSRSTATRRAIHQLLHGRPERRAVPRARLPRGGHDDHAVRHGRAERDEPLPPLHRGAARARGRTPADAAALVASAARCSRRHRAYIARAPRGHARGPRLDVDRRCRLR